jgi:hypothetical protein
MNMATLSKQRPQYLAANPASPSIPPQFEGYYSAVRNFIVALGVGNQEFCKRIEPSRGRDGMQVE